MYVCPLSFNCTHKVLYLYQYFTTTISECLVLSLMDVCYPIGNYWHFTFSGAYCILTITCYLFMFYICFYVMTGPRVKQPVADELSCINMFYYKKIFQENCVDGVLMHWVRDEMAAVCQTTFSIAFSWMKMYDFRLRFHWSLFLIFKLTIIHHWFS